MIARPGLSSSHIQKPRPLDVSDPHHDPGRAPEKHRKDILEALWVTDGMTGTTQACLFRDDYEPLTATGFSIYGLSTDAPKANTSFKSKQNLPYTLLCDPSTSLIAAIGMKKAPKGTTRGVFVVDKEGKVLASEAGGPAATVDVVKKLVGAPANTHEDVGNLAEGSKVEKEIEDGKADAIDVEVPAASNGEAEQKEDQQKADVAADVADTAEKLDDSLPA